MEEESDALQFLHATKAEVTPMGPADGSIVSGEILRAGVNYDGKVFTEECLKDIAEQASNLTYKDGALSIRGPIKDGKIAIQPKDVS